MLCDIDQELSFLELQRASGEAIHTANGAEGPVCLPLQYNTLAAFL